VVAVLAGVAMLGACSGSEDQQDPTPSSARAPSSRSVVDTGSSPSAPSPSPSRTLTADEQAAVKAYLAFTRAVYTAERAPGPQNLSLLKRYSIDPELGSVTDFLTKLQLAGLVVRGTPPASRVHVIGYAPKANPFPAVSLVDCPTVSTTWRPYYKASGKPGKVVQGKAKPPYASRATVVLFKGVWKVRTVKTNRNKTCSPA